MSSTILIRDHIHNSSDVPKQLVARLLAPHFASVLLPEAVATELVELISEAGYVIVPRLPTAEMLDAAWADALAEDAKGVWGAMINAAPLMTTSETL
ncbi:MAG: hypothetical protein ABSG65_37095 [Bryobacteraceae bacterium]